MSLFLDWLADLGRKREPQRPRRPMKPEVRSVFDRLTAERRKLRPTDPRNAGVELEAAWFSAMLEESERDLRAQLRVCHCVIAALTAALAAISTVLGLLL